MENRFRKNMKLTPNTLTFFVDDILEMWFIVDTKIDVSSANTYKIFCQDAFILTGKLVNKSLKKSKIKEAVEYMLDVHEATLLFVGETGFKEKHNFDKNLFDKWAKSTIQSLYDSAS